MYLSKECRHLKTNGLKCKSPAMRGSAYCYFHARPPRPTRPARIQEANLDIAAVISHDGILPALNQILQALAANRISPRRAGILLQVVQMASNQDLSDPDYFDLPPDFPPQDNLHPPRLKD